MLDAVSIDQLRTFIAAAETGSFSAAGRQINRAQSVVSQAIANLETELGVTLFERAGRYPVLTEPGRILLADARIVAASLSALKARAKGMEAGLEPELSVAIDVMFPMDVLTRTAAAFGENFAATPLRLYVEALGGVAQAVLDRQCQIGVVGTLPINPPELVSERLLSIKMIYVAAPGHPLARIDPPVSKCDLAAHVQLVLTDRTTLSQGREFGVLSPRNWRLADLGAKHSFLRAGLGWGSMPFNMIERDLQEGTLRQIHIQDVPSEGETMSMSAAYRIDSPPGPAGRWFVDQLKRFAQDIENAGNTFDRTTQSPGLAAADGTIYVAGDGERSVLALGAI